MPRDVFSHRAAIPRSDAGQSSPVGNADTGCLNNGEVASVSSANKSARNSWNVPAELTTHQKQCKDALDQNSPVIEITPNRTSLCSSGSFLSQQHHATASSTGQEVDSVLTNQERPSLQSMGNFSPAAHFYRQRSFTYPVTNVDTYQQVQERLHHYQTLK